MSGLMHLSRSLSLLHPNPQQVLFTLPIMADKQREDSLHESVEKNDMLHAEVLAEPELMSGAYEAENREHNQGLWVCLL